MELLNYIRFKENRVEPSVKNSSVNCSINVITMRCLVDRQQLVQIKSHFDIKENLFKLNIDLENDYSHFEGTDLLAKHGPQKPIATKPANTVEPKPQSKTNVTAPKATKPVQTKPVASKPTSSTNFHSKFASKPLNKKS